MDTRDHLILAEVKLREQQRQAVAKLIGAITAELFDKQIGLWRDPAKRKAALCTRRAGKTQTWVRVATCTGLEHPRSLVRIWAINRLRCKQLIWDELLMLLARHQIKFEKNETELTVKLSNGSEIRLLGADKDKEAQKKRGDKTICEIVIEAQLFGSYLEKLVNDVIDPCLFDLQGTLYLEGTPGVTCGGYWFDVTGNENTASLWQSKGVTHDKGTDHERTIGAGWSCHHWTLFDNPKLPNAKTARADLERKMRENNWTYDDPTYVREYKGRWVNDYNALYYAFDPVRNTYTEVTPWGPGWMHTLGWDLGAKDDMALVVWGFHPKYPVLFEAFSWKKPGAGFEEINEQLNQLKQQFSITEMFADTQGGGKMFVEEFVKHYPHSFQAAKKSDKYAHVLFMNGDLRSGFIKLRPGSEYAQEIANLPKKQPWPDPEHPQDPPTEHPGFPNHCCDAGLYAYRACMHYLHTPAKPDLVPQSKQWFAEQEAAIIRQIEQKKSRSPGVWLNKYDDDPEDWLDRD